MSLANDASDPVGAYLVSPDGDTLGYGQNSTDGTQTLSLTAYTLNPVPGTWTLIVAFTEPTAGNEISEPYTGNIVFNDVSVSAAGLPDSTGTKLAAGTPVTVPVTITNNGAAPEEFFVDPRLNQTASITLASQDQITGLALPLTGGEPRLVRADARRPAPAPRRPRPCRSCSTVGPFQGDPDIASHNPGAGPLCADHRVGQLQPAGRHRRRPASGSPRRPSAGRTPAPGAGGHASTRAMTVAAKQFDTSVTSTPATSAGVHQPGGDRSRRSSSTRARPAVIDVTITPSGATGTQVQRPCTSTTCSAGSRRTASSPATSWPALPYAYTIK